MSITSKYDINYNDKNSKTLQNSKKYSYTSKPSKSSLSTSKRLSVTAISCSSLITDPQKFIPPTSKKIKLRESWQSFRGVTKDNDIKGRRKNPFPSLRWADKQEMWDLMCKKDNGIYKRPTGDQILLRHSAIQPKMRAILLDWLTEVCQEYLLHRETFYLAVDFIDRYLGSIKDIPKTSLQSVGVTCLFIASKLEEIYPPKLNGFSFYTDGACSEDEILDMELIVLKELDWGLAPITPNRWMKAYMQMNHFDGLTKKDKRGNYSPDSGLDSTEDIMFPQYTEREFIQAMQLMDLVILDLGCMSFSYSVLSASILYYFQGQQSTLSVSGYTWKELSVCVEWLAPFALALRDSNDAIETPHFTGILKEDQHNIQTHSIDLSLLEQAQVYQRQDLIENDQDEGENTSIPDEDIKDFATEVLPAKHIDNNKHGITSTHNITSKTTDSHVNSKPVQKFYSAKNDRNRVQQKIDSRNGIPVISQYYKQRK